MVETFPEEEFVWRKSRLIYSKENKANTSSGDDSRDYKRKPGEKATDKCPSTALSGCLPTSSRTKGTSYGTNSSLARQSRRQTIYPSLEFSSDSHESDSPRFQASTKSSEGKRKERSRITKSPVRTQHGRQRALENTSEEQKHLAVIRRRTGYTLISNSGAKQEESPNREHGRNSFGHTSHDQNWSGGVPGLNNQLSLVHRAPRERRTQHVPPNNYLSRGIEQGQSQEGGVYLSFPFR